MNEKEYTIELHDEFCTMAHEDMCGWAYEFLREEDYGYVEGKEIHNWNEPAHKKWLEIAIDLIDDNIDVKDLINWNDIIKEIY